ncbi:hypothetical protein EIP91_001611 [Steccherinum ochraceum]|uniref:4'-phosphopantetheinyl transferase domain-containing protein n=1 Tax=Steccherinum ochraceum TaxID=92696 RepID=A0A4R0RQY7_9APHY|nr:hypothetical protein EIP91_001611 [Steccherinum ochraceum]
MECPILVWMLTFNRELTSEEYDQCYQTMRACIPHSNVQYSPGSKESCSNHTNLIGMVMTQGSQHHVVNLGLAIIPLAPEHPNISISTFLESQYHKEIAAIQDPSPERRGESSDEMIMRRLCMLLTLKQAYIRAIGQPMGFDYTRLDFDVPRRTVNGDGKALHGWEFRVWQAHIEILRPDGSTDEQVYQCASAFFRGTHDINFVWQRDAKELESWVQFLTPDQLMAVMPKLTD